jgi:hypothetical protein
LFRNDGAGTFTEVGAGANVANVAGGADVRGTALVDFDADGRLDLALGTGGGGVHLLRNTGALVFADVTAAAGLASTGDVFEVEAADLDLDGFEDLVVIVRAGAHHVYLNDGDGTFTRAPEADVPADPGASGAALGDHDADGDLDLFVAHAGGAFDRLYRNDLGAGGNWLALRLTGGATGVAATTDLSNRGAIGARVRVVAGGVVMQRVVTSGEGWMGASSPRVHFGLGRAHRVERVTIDWPGGITQTLADLDVNHYVDVTERRPLGVTSIEIGGGAAAPVPLGRGTIGNAVTIRGGPFRAGARVVVAGAGVTVTGVTVEPDAIVALVDVAANAPSGLRDLIVQNTDHASARVPDAVVILGQPPTVERLLPPSSPPNIPALVVKVVGSGFDASTVFTTDTPAIEITQVTLKSSRVVDLVKITTPSFGPHLVLATNQDGQQAAGTPLILDPTVLAVSSTLPAGLRRGQQSGVQIRGAGFPLAPSPAPTVTFAPNPQHFQVLSTVVNSQTVMTATVKVDVNAVPGLYDLTVTSGGQSATGVRVFSVLATAPAAASVTPAQGSRGDAGLVLDVRGTSFQSGTKLEVAGTGVSVTSADFVDSTRLLAVVTIAADAALGTRDVLVYDNVNN